MSNFRFSFTEASTCRIGLITAAVFFCNGGLAATSQALMVGADTLTTYIDLFPQGFLGRTHCICEALLVGELPGPCRPHSSQCMVCLIEFLVCDYSSFPARTWLQHYTCRASPPQHCVGTSVTLLEAVLLPRGCYERALASPASLVNSLVILFGLHEAASLLGTLLQDSVEALQMHSLINYLSFLKGETANLFQPPLSQASGRPRRGVASGL